MVELSSIEDERLLQTGLAAMHIEHTETQLQLLLRYIQYLTEWSATVNLTAIRDPRRIITHHILDSLALLPFLEGENILDVGSGAGLPGIPLAIMAPDRKITLLDKKLKSIHFLRHVAHSLQLPGVEVVHSLVERYEPPSLFSCVVSRAVFACPALAAQVVTLLDSGSALLAMQGKQDLEIRHQLPVDVVMEAVHSVRIFALEAERHVVICRKK